MPSDHPGFAYWSGTDPNYPVGPIELREADAQHAIVHARFALPQAQPTPRTVAERMIGITRSAQFWFALECTTDAQGVVRCEAVLRGRHAHVFVEHGETEAGPTQEVRLTAADMAQAGHRQQIAPHGEHCDTFTAWWHLDQGQVAVELSTWHWEKSVRQFLADREEAKKNSKTIIILEPLEPNSDWEPAPEPTEPAPPEIGPDGT